MYPVPGKVFQKFGQKWIADRDFILNGQQVKKGDDIYLKFFNLVAHNGIDLVATLDEPIRAALSGYLVQQTDKPTGYGLRVGQKVVINGKYYFVVYGHLNSFEKPDEIIWDWDSKVWVNEGDVIGYAGTSGFSSGVHLHLGVIACKENGETLNPNNGFGGCIDPLLLISKTMSNAKLIQIGSELGYWFPAITGDGLKSQAANVGEVLPEKADGGLDWDKIKPDFKI